MTTLEAKLSGWRIGMLTLGTNKFGLQCPATSHAEFSIIGKFTLAMRALHQENPPTELQSMTAGQECQALPDCTT
jgi:hypothetical protein